MAILRARSPLVEQVSVDEAYVDLAAVQDPPGWEDGRLEAWCADLLGQIAAETGFCDSSHLIRTFRETESFTPEACRAAHKRTATA